MAWARTPERLLSPVWPLPRSLATTKGISVDVFSSPYLDVSVQAVPLIYLFDSVYDVQKLLCTDFSIRKSAGQSLLTTHRSLSQLTTSFFGSQCQGIHPALFFALPFALQKLSFLLILIQRFIMQNFSDFSDWQTFVVFTRLQISILTLRILFDVVVLWFSSQTRSFLIFALHLLFSFQDTKAFEVLPSNFLLLSKQISEERLFVFFLLKSVLKSGPKWTRTTDLTLIRRAL